MRSKQHIILGPVTALLPILTMLVFAANGDAQQVQPHLVPHQADVPAKPVTVEAVPADIITVPDTQSPPGNVGNDWPAPVEDSEPFASLRVEQLELRLMENADIVRWDVIGWFGGDYNRFWWKSEGDWEMSNSGAGKTEVQALYGRLIARYWDLQLGVRYDYLSKPGDKRSRMLAVIGLQGFAPYKFEIEPALFISQDGDLSGRLTATYDLLLTQRLILQPRVDLDAALRSVDKFGVGKGINSLDLGVRLRYEVTREFAPYMGIQWSRKFGETAAFARSDGESTEDVEFLFGLSIRF